MKKALYLFLALLLPGLVFVFLKYAGSNKFDIPVYYEDGVTDQAGYCPPVGPRAYILPDSAWSHTNDIHDMANVLIFAEGTGLDANKIKETITAELGSTGLTFVNETSLSPDSTVRARWKQCIFLVRNPWQSVLFDATGRIRGYYDLSSRDELDRLRVELKILLEQY